MIEVVPQTVVAIEMLRIEDSTIIPSLCLSNQKYSTLVNFEFVANETKVAPFTVN
jgi:hypothetical protein